MRLGQDYWWKLPAMVLSLFLGLVVGQYAYFYFKQSIADGKAAQQERLQVCQDIQREAGTSSDVKARALNLCLWVGTHGGFPDDQGVSR